MIIMIIVAIKTVMAIETIMHSYCDRPGHRNQDGYRDRLSFFQN